VSREREVARDGGREEGTLRSGGGSGRRRKKKRTAEDEPNRLCLGNARITAAAPVAGGRSTRWRPNIFKRRGTPADRAFRRWRLASARALSRHFALARQRTPARSRRSASTCRAGRPGRRSPFAQRAPRSAAAVAFSFWRHRAGRADDRADGGRGRPLAGADVPPPAPVLRRVGAVRLVRALAQGSEGSL
jgi:hypothetical protein